MAASLVALLAVMISACTHRETIFQAENETGGNWRVGRHLIYSYGCGSCHVIPGVAEAKGTVGPPLEGFASRIYIAGSLENTPENLFRWIAKPQEIVPGSAMPDLGISDGQAHDIAAYLYTLQ
ncbi:MAG: c-type cytochrome [Acidobacteriaceae bacterium]|nr:c-type cytochrome [Acidobacteriaceae bacterium]